MNGTLAPQRRRALLQSRFLESIVVAFWVNASACGGQPPAARPASVVTHTEPDKPRLEVIERDGDPASALAIAVFTNAAAATNAQIAQSAAASLERAGYLASSRAADNAILLAVLLDSEAKAEHAAEQLRAALLTGPLVKRAPSLRRANLCGFDTVQETPAQVRAEIGQQSARLALVGNGAVLRAAIRGYEHGLAWPQGPGIDDPWPADDSVSSEGLPGHLSLAIRTEQIAKAPAAADALLRADSSLRLAAEAFRPPWRLLDATAILRPRGACLVAEFQGSGTASAEVATALSSYLAAALANTPGVNPATLVGASDPREAALAAAWLAFNGEQPPKESRWVVHAGPDASRLQATFHKLEPPLIGLNLRPEKGQGRIWALLTSRCSTAHELPETSGHTFAALSVAARSAPKSPHLQLEPWFNGSQVGIIGSVSALDTDSANELAQALGRALLSVGRSEQVAAATRSELLEWAPASPGWQRTLSLISGDQPGRITATGVGSELSAFSASAAERAMRGFSSHPLELVVLGNANAAQATALNRELATLLWPLRGAVQPCAATPWSAAVPGEYDSASWLQTLPALEAGGSPSDAAPSSAQAWIAFSTPAGSRAALDRLAEVLNAPGGWLERAVRPSAPVSYAQASVFGGLDDKGALVVHLRALNTAIDPAIAQVRALFVSLATADAKTIDKAARTGRAIEAQLDPRVRMSQVLWPRAKPASAVLVQRLLREHFGSAQAIVVRSLVPDSAAP
ncbi:MAG TPA: hypothetical protein VHM70_12695 [Polyangiaceae bacterium]|nr:hypothetical protein [Polyangiaceae bacterium]